MTAGTALQVRRSNNLTIEQAPRVVENLHQRRIRARYRALVHRGHGCTECLSTDIHRHIPNVAEHIDQWVRWNA